MVKRVFDFCFALVLFVILIPVFIIISFLVWLKLGSPVLFRQTRPGIHGIPFVLYKFRSMTEEKDAQGQFLPDEQRFSRFSRLLRQSSLDELPELFNVIKGDMSLVGPRPLLMKYLDLYSPEQARRHEVTPGITGWAQVNGRNLLSWEDRFKLDVWYVDNKNIWLDIKILLRTVLQVYKQEGVNQKDHVTVQEFTGNQDNGGQI
ncbi:MAG: sugar transferase [Proteobacteria bacterium]|nr:sugar transferase [Pseudomonadota bacterium]MBU1389515.1 sugar transferase [Pseudomonadota bacterium]MBU1541335.1 sugar transferase [Pseudomonadota bacterium]MBU2429734.1 sugar transferase [Pseudomonadota bacterium]MBU2482924.1 sugar transferase [Pseudomonadota bacterium]